MKYVITGGAGHISKPLTEKLLAAGHQVTVIGRDASKLKDLTALGATAAIGSVEDVAFLTGTFTGANAVYLMVPPNFGATDIKVYIEQIGRNYAQALKASGVTKAALLSSMGAHLPTGAGPVNGLHRAELALNAVPGLNIVHLRPAFFYYNLFANLGLVRNLGIMGNNFSIPAGRFPIVDPSDIAAAAAEVLLNPDFTGNSIRYIVSDEIGTDQIAATVGKALGKEDLKWITFTNDQSYDGMLQAGLPENIAKNYVEMGEALQSGTMLEDYWKNRHGNLGKVKLGDFAQSFAAAYNAG